MRPRSVLMAAGLMAGTLGACNALNGLGDYEQVPGDRPPAETSGSGGTGGEGGTTTTSSGMGGLGGGGGTGGSGGGILPNGEPCTAGNECMSGHCTDDGLCCDNACDGPCQACNMAGMEGTCVMHAASDDPEDACADEGAATCGTTGACDGNGACKFYGTTTPCGDAAACTAGTQTSADMCDGMGACTDNGTMDCAPYVCGGTTCLTMCGNNLNCVTTHFCDMGTDMCMPKLANGQACTGNGNTCQSGNCVDGVCCDTACAGVCQACNIIGMAGTCSNLPQGTTDPVCLAPNTTCNAMGNCKLPGGASCMLDTECASGNCSSPPIMICTNP